MSPIHRMLDRVRQMRFFTISFLLHFVLITLLGGVVLFKAAQQPEAFVNTGGGLVEAAAEFTDDMAEEPPAAPEMESAPETPTDEAPPAQASAIVALTNSAVSISAPATTQFQTSGVSLSATIGSSLSTRMTSSPSAKQSGALSSRSGEERGLRMQQTGGKKESEEAVLAGLRWLRANQNADGTWGQNYRGAMTGFALLCFLGHGELPGQSVEFGSSVAKGIAALVQEGTKSNGRLTFGGGLDYQQGIATYALAEAYAMTQDPKVGELLMKSVDLIIQGQGSDGGWNYGSNKEIPSDTSVSGWMIQALKTAKLAELKHEGIQPALDNAVKNIDRVFNKANGTFGYRVAGDRGGGLTGVGVLCKLFLEGRSSKMVRDGLDAIFNEGKLEYKGPGTNLYAWYYNTQACFQAQGSAWNKWNRMFQDELVKNQSKDGSWPPHGGKEHGGMNEVAPDQNVYRTTLCILMLEVYYRYSPVSKNAPSS